jgi:uncharacterized protein (TIGR02594 family)
MPEYTPPSNTPPTDGSNTANDKLVKLYDKVYSSPSVFANFSQITLAQEPKPSPAIGAPEAIQVTLSIMQQDAIASSAANANSAAEAEVGLAGKGEVPHEGPLEKTSPSESDGAYSAAGGFPAKLDPNADPSKIFAVLGKNMDAALSEAKRGAWKENGRNDRILACYKAVGSNLSADSTPWCAAFAGSVMKASGVQALKTLSSLAYRGFGTVVPVNDKTKWRLNDIIIFSRKGGGHIGFFRGYNPSTGSILIAGGNQSDNLTETSFRGSGEMPVVSVSRAWTVPPEYDKPVTYSGTAGGSVKVV